jgi:type VI secretion system FHA domain protein
MRLRMGEYEILVLITADTDQFTSDYDSFSPFHTPISDAFPIDTLNNPLLTTDNLSDPFAHLENHFNPLSKGSEPSLLFPQDNFSPTLDKQPSNYKSLMDENIPSIHDSFIPSAPITNPYTTNEIPDDFNFEDLFNTPADDNIGIQNKVADVPNVVASTPDAFDIFPIAEAIQSGNTEIPLSPQKSAIETVMNPDQLSKKPVEVVQSRPVIPANTDAELFNAFLNGAGLENKNLKPENTVETMRLVGSMFRHLVDGTVAVLRTRTEFKSQFRVSITTIKAVDNNPLKFSVTPEEAACHLLNNGQGGFKPSVAAIDEGFNDIVSHQMAMQAGIQAALVVLFRKFDPRLIEKQFEAGLVLQKKSKCWEKYVNLYPEIVEQMTEDFFGEAFAEAYEKQMKRVAGGRTEK